MKINKKLLFVLLFILCFSASAQFGSVGLTTGLSVPTGKWSPGFSTSLFSNLKIYYKDLFFQPHLIFHMAGHSTTINNNHNVDLSLMNYAAGINVLKVVHTFGRGKAVFAGVGVNYNIIGSDKIRDSYDSLDREVYSDTDYKVGISALSSYMHKFRKFAGYAETKYTYLQNNNGYFNIAIGALYFIR